MSEPSPGASVTLPRALSIFAATARAEILRDHSIGSCVASTWITVETFRRLGFRASHLEVRVAVGNPEYLRLRTAFGRPPRSEAELESWSANEGAHVVGIGFDEPSRTGIGGHVVALVEGHYLVDASINQADDLRHGLRLPPVLFGPVGARFSLGASVVQRMDTGGMFVEYQRHVIQSPWRTGYDWTANPETSSAVRRILEQIAPPRDQ